jgi:hypothetical protein
VHAFACMPACIVPYVIHAKGMRCSASFISMQGLLCVTHMSHTCGMQCTGVEWWAAWPACSDSSLHFETAVT